MARAGTKTTKRKAASKRPGPIRRAWLWLRRWLWRAVFGVVILAGLLVLLFAVVRPPTTPYMIAERLRIGAPLDRDWVPMTQIAPVMARSAVAAEDANYCLHWGLDLDAIRTSIEAGGQRGASTISQQTVKNVYLWHGRSYLRKVLEAVLTPVVEAVWSKRWILEVYLNVAEFDTGVFGVQAAARHYFGVDAVDLTPVQAARLAAILPDPKGRSASDPSSFVRQRAASILSGAETIAADGRASCFERL